ncbi:hypothetical protein TNIN_233521 [Trichonephila inaurata madagascariensis]|uniref:Uncharacterized protein n=1 Tax=Trichonephila inaurata madagascariensis TaxID=2747483 RepID=A0A8X7BUB8_9ARAC|nr:hypothetical protein TNIN_233521 [Trichonephila inaurata madagascariensis]
MALLEVLEPQQNRGRKNLLSFLEKKNRETLYLAQENDEWGIPNNHEIYRKYGKYGGTDCEHYKSSRISWLGHLYRYADAFPTKRVTFSKNEGTRRRGRPTTRWLGDVEKDINYA